jgi:hypothetical protein
MIDFHLNLPHGIASLNKSVIPKVKQLWKPQKHNGQILRIDFNFVRGFRELDIKMGSDEVIIVHYKKNNGLAKLFLVLDSIKTWDSLNCSKNLQPLGIFSVPYTAIAAYGNFTSDDLDLWYVEDIQCVLCNQIFSKKMGDIQTCPHCHCCFEV